MSRTQLHLRVVIQTGLPGLARRLYVRTANLTLVRSPVGRGASAGSRSCVPRLMPLQDESGLNRVTDLMRMPSNRLTRRCALPLRCTNKQQDADRGQQWDRPRQKECGVV